MVWCISKAIILPCQKCTLEKPEWLVSFLFAPTIFTPTFPPLRHYNDTLNKRDFHGFWSKILLKKCHSQCRILGLSRMIRWNAPEKYTHETNKCPRWHYTNHLHKFDVVPRPSHAHCIYFKIQTQVLSSLHSRHVHSRHLCCRFCIMWLTDKLGCSPLAHAKCL